MSFITRNLGLKIASLLISLVLWDYVSVISYTVPHLQTFKLDYSSLDRTRFALIGRPPAQIPINVLGSPEALSSLQGLNPDEFVGYVDLTNAQPGIGRYRIKLNDPPREGVQYQQPGPVTVEIEPLVDFPRKVKVNFDEIPFGYTLSEANVTPESVDLIGPASAVAQVASCMARLDLTGFKAGQIYGSVTVELLDSKQRPVQGVMAEPSTVKISPILEPSKNLKTVPVDLNWTGALSDYTLSEAPRIRPQQITLRGPTDVLDTITQVETEPIDLSRIHGDTVIRVKIQRPRDGVTTKTTTVSVSIRVNRKENAPIVHSSSSPLTAPPIAAQPAH